MFEAAVLRGDRKQCFLPAPTSSQSAHPLPLELLRRRPQQTPRTRAQWTASIRIPEADQEERHVVLPGDAPEAAEIGHRDEISIAVLLVADLELLEIHLVVHVPAEHDGAEAEAVGGDGQEFLLGHQLAAQHAVDVDGGHFDFGVILEERGESIERDLWVGAWAGHVECSEFWRESGEGGWGAWWSLKTIRTLRAKGKVIAKPDIEESYLCAFQRIVDRFTWPLLLRSRDMSAGAISSSVMHPAPGPWRSSGQTVNKSGTE